MALVGINTGSAANAGDGSTLRAGANIVNANFTEIYDYFGDGTNLTFTGGNWVEVSAGINTLNYVGIGTTNPTDPLTVRGGANISGVVTGSKFSGILSATDAVVSGVGSFNNDIFVGAGVSLYGSTGFVSATKYYGDGSSLLSVPSGLGTALSEDSNSPLNKIYYVDASLGVGQTITINPPSSSQVAFTNYPNINVEEGYDLIVADGDDFIPDILGIGTTGIGGVLSGGGGRVRADNYTSKDGGAANFPAGATVSGILTCVGFAMTDISASGVVTSTGGFVGDLTGDVDGARGDFSANLYAVTGIITTLTVGGNLSVGSDLSVTDSIALTNDITVGGSCTITGNLTVDGTQTIVNTSTLDIADKTVGIASTTAANNSTANGAGIEIYASSGGAGGGPNNNKTLTWNNGSGAFEYNVPNKFKGVHETVSGVTTYSDASGNLVLECDVQAQTVFTYTVPAASASGRGSNIGIVSFKNIPIDAMSVTTPTIIFYQASSAHGGATGYGNTLATNGIGLTCTISPIKDGSATSPVGIQTRAWIGGAVGSSSTVTLSSPANYVDIVSFMIYYQGGSTATGLVTSSFKVYATKNGGFNYGTLGI